MSGSSGSSYLNGSNLFNSNAGYIGTTASGYGLGARWQSNASGVGYMGAYPFNGYIYEALVYNTPLSSTDRQRVEGYLAWKWGTQNLLVASNPYTTGAPVNSIASNYVVSGPGKGFSPNYTMDTVMNTRAACAVCSDSNWSAYGGVTLQTCSAINTILNPISSNYINTFLPNPIPGMTWSTASNGVAFARLTGDCPPNNSAQTPHYASNYERLPPYNPLNEENTIATPYTIYGAYTPKNKARA
jgi:hypothetical protein